MRLPIKPTPFIINDSQYEKQLLIEVCEYKNEIDIFLKDLCQADKKKNCFFFLKKTDKRNDHDNINIHDINHYIIIIFDRRLEASKVANWIELTLVRSSTHKLHNKYLRLYMT